MNYVSGYIPFTKEASMLNRCIADNSILREVFYTVPSIPKANVVYKNFNNQSEFIQIDNKNLKN